MILTVLEEHPGTHDRRYWASGSTWLYPGDQIVVLTKEEIEVLETEDRFAQRIDAICRPVMRVMILGTVAICGALTLSAVIVRGLG